MAMQFHERVAIVTGGAQGIGKSITSHFLQKGAVVFVVDSDEEAGKEIESEFKLLGKIHFLHTDVSSEKEVKRVISDIIKKYKRLDFVINNAGVTVVKPLNKLSLTEWDRIIGVNLSSVFLFSKYAAPHLKVTHGVIVNMASTRALMSEPDTEAYAATKGGIVALTHALAISLGPEIRVNCISPGWIETGDAKKSRTRRHVKHSEADKSQHPVGRVGNPDDIADMVMYLVSSKSSFITGQNFIIDGGMTRKMIYV
jgi:NAD(P)-dependent dehydrogenase (short-subunit alcohol dehydrogenase family)